MSGVKQAVSTDLSLMDILADASIPVWIIMILLAVISIISWAVIFHKAASLKIAKKEAKVFEQRFWSGIDLNELFTQLGKNPKNLKGLSAIFYAGYREFGMIKGKKGATAGATLEGVFRAMRVAQSRETENQDSGLSFLATVGSVSPYVGLLGTVWGIMKSFLSLGGQTSVTLGDVAPGIAEALIATAIGLFAAIPAVIAYNRFSQKAESIETQYENFIDDFVGLLQRRIES